MLKTSSSHVLKTPSRRLQDQQMFAGTVLTYFFVNLGDGESDENDDSNFEILLHFEEVIVAE